MASQEPGEQSAAAVPIEEDALLAHLQVQALAPRGGLKGDDVADPAARLRIATAVLASATPSAAAESLLLARLDQLQQAAQAMDGDSPQSSAPDSGHGHAGDSAAPTAPDRPRNC